MDGEGRGRKGEGWGIFQTMGMRTSTRKRGCKGKNIKYRGKEEIVLDYKKRDKRIELHDGRVEEKGAEENWGRRVG